MFRDTSTCHSEGLNVRCVFSHPKASFNIYHVRVNDGPIGQLVIAKEDMHRYGKLVEETASILRRIAEGSTAYILNIPGAINQSPGRN